MPHSAILPRWPDLKSIPVQSWAILLLLPCLNLISVLVLRNHAGPFWMWSNLDPDYFYLLDSLNMTNLDWPGVYQHPGTPLQVLGALVLKAAHPLASADQLTEMVLKNPERYLSLIHICLVSLNTIALGFAGICGYLFFREPLPVLFLQLGPFISTLCIKWMTHVAPEPLLISVVLILGSVCLLAIRPDQTEQNKSRYAFFFGIIAGFGLATKITSVGIYFLPVFLLWNWRWLAIYGGTTALALLIFTLPAADSYGNMVTHLMNIIVGNGENTTASPSASETLLFLTELIRVSSRPAFFLVLLIGLITTGILWAQFKSHGKPFPTSGKLLAGLCLANIMQALAVANHPSGHYMVPALTLSTLGMALLYKIWMDQRHALGSSGRYLKVFFLLLFVGLLSAQTLAALKLDRQFKSRVVAAAQYDMSRFNQCARIYFWAAATPSYGLQLGDFMTRNRFTEQLSQIRPDNDYWYEVESKEFRNWSGPYALADIADTYPCIVARGTLTAHITPELKRQLPDHAFSNRCSGTPNSETLFTSGVDCEGKLQPAD